VTIVAGLLLPAGVEFCPHAQWKYRALIQTLMKFDRVFYPDKFSPLKLRKGTFYNIGQMRSQEGTDTWTVRVAWPGHEYEVYVKEHDC